MSGNNIDGFDALGGMAWLPQTHIGRARAGGVNLWEASGNLKEHHGF